MIKLKMSATEVEVAPSEQVKPYADDKTPSQLVTIQEQLQRAATLNTGNIPPICEAKAKAVTGCSPMNPVEIRY